MLSLFSPWPWIALLVVSVFSFWKGYDAGNSLGPNARLVAQIQRQLAQTNAELTALKATDERDREIEDARREAAAKAAGSIVSCPIRKTDVDLINAVGRD